MCGKCETGKRGTKKARDLTICDGVVLLPISTKTRLMKALVWPVVMYGCESCTLRKNEETRLEAFEMKGLRKILRVSWTAKKTNEWVLNKAGVKR